MHSSSKVILPTTFSDTLDDRVVGFTAQFAESFVGFDELLAPVLG
jgi:hypothetical protein